MTKLELWIKTERHMEFAQILALPIMREALDVVLDDAMPKPNLVERMIGADSAQDATWHLAAAQAGHAGIHRAIIALRNLGKPMTKVEMPEAPEPFAQHTPESVWGPNAA